MADYRVGTIEHPTVRLAVAVAAFLPVLAREAKPSGVRVARARARSTAAGRC
jgi:hypothetical protein